MFDIAKFLPTIKYFQCFPNVSNLSFCVKASRYKVFSIACSTQSLVECEEEIWIICYREIIHIVEILRYFCALIWLFCRLIIRTNNKHSAINITMAQVTHKTSHQQKNFESHRWCLLSSINCQSTNSKCERNDNETWKPSASISTRAVIRIVYKRT